MLELAADFGNGFSLLADGHRCVSLKSVYAQAKQNMPNTNFDSTVRYIHNGNLYVVGDASVGLKESTKTLDTTKPEAAKFIFPALAIQLLNVRPLMDVCLTVVDTNPKTNEKAYHQALMGDHHYSYEVNDQTKVTTFKVVEVQVVREGLGTFNRYVAAKGFPTENGKNLVAVQNIGAGTMDMLLYDSLGNEVNSYTLQDMGCSKFAQYISGKLRETGKLDGDLPIEQMFTALETGKLTYWDRLQGSTKELDITKLVGKAAKEYYMGAMKKLVGQLSEYRTQIGKVIFTGGLATHVNLTEKESKRCAIALNPLVDNVLGV